MSSARKTTTFGRRPSAALRSVTESDPGSRTAPSAAAIKFRNMNGKLLVAMSDRPVRGRPILVSSSRCCEILLGATLLATVISMRGADADEPLAGSPAARAAVLKSLPLLQAGAKSFRERSEGRCVSCHHQGLVLQTVALARQRGFRVDEALAKEEAD